MTSRATPAPQPPDRRSELMALVAAARARVRSLRSGTVDREQLQLAQTQLLDAMELYAAELARRRMPVPPSLRDDLRLYRELAARPSVPRPYRPRDQV